MSRKTWSTRLSLATWINCAECEHRPKRAGPISTPTGIPLSLCFARRDLHAPIGNVNGPPSLSKTPPPQRFAASQQIASWCSNCSDSIVTKPRVVILDIDGTLLLSNDAHARAFVEAGKSLGLSADLPSIRRLIGKGGDKLIPEAFGFDAESEPGKKLQKVKDRMFRSYAGSLQPAPGARELLLKLRSDGIKLVVATSAGKDDVTFLLDQARVRDLIEETTSSDDAESSKPDPDIIQAALRKAGEDARVAIMIGDTPYDVEAA